GGRCRRALSREGEGFFFCDSLVGSVMCIRDRLGAALADFDRAPEWFTLHSAWRGDPPGRLAEGDAFAQQLLLMDIPAEVRWTVVSAGATGLVLRGTGPMGIVLGLWATVVADGAGSLVRVDVGADGPPLRGPVGTTVMRSIDAALRVSVDRIAAMDAGASARPQWTVRDEPVVHAATGRVLDPVSYTHLRAHETVAG
ncbi:hypothetical protein AERO_18515, partial [Aeromicrobium fastidiosum]|nr:hypothetical protein [Aeromicrobium fastidiosum]